MIDVNSVVEQFLRGMPYKPDDMSEMASSYNSCSRLLPKPVVKLASQASNIATIEFSSDATMFFTGAHSGVISIYKMTGLKAEVFEYV